MVRASAYRYSQRQGDHTDGELQVANPRRRKPAVKVWGKIGLRSTIREREAVERTEIRLGADISPHLAHPNGETSPS